MQTLSLLRRLLSLGLLVGSMALAAQPSAVPANRTFEVIDAMDVENHWPAGEHVNWQTGVPDGRPETSPGKHTHCSAFVAAAAKQLGIYILRPPEHSQVLLANAQYDWLASADGQAKGWQALPDAQAAQQRANQGWLVVASYHNRRDDKPGHIAIVRPASAKHQGELLVTQAGGHNYRSVALEKGFADHKRALRNNEIRYFAHEVTLRP